MQKYLNVSMSSEIACPINTEIQLREVFRELTLKVLQIFNTTTSPYLSQNL